MSADNGGSSGASTQHATPRPESVKSKQDETTEREASESTPLLAQSNGDLEAANTNENNQGSASSLLRSFQSKTKPTRRWPSFVALMVLCIIVILIMVIGFVAPSTVEEYAMEAAHFEPTSLSIDSFTSTGIKARIQGDFSMDASKVKKKSVRDFGRFGTWIAREVESGESQVEVTLPEYGNLLLGTAQIPRVKVNVQNGHTTHVDFLSDVQPGDFDALKRIATQWIDGRLGQLRVVGKASVPVKSGIFSFGTQSLTQSLSFNSKGHGGKGDMGRLPALPPYKIQNINVHDARLPPPQKGMAADVSLQVTNPYPFGMMVPSLGFAIFVEGCSPNEPLLQLGDAFFGQTMIRPKDEVHLNVTGIVKHLPKRFTQACPDNGESPLDMLLGKYIKGDNVTAFVRGAKSPSKNTPHWISDLLSDITVPVPVPGQKLGHLIKSFNLANTHFALPDPFAEPNTPESNPTVSATVKALVALPAEMNVNLNVSHVKADADVMYHGKKLGELHIREWQPANSTRIEAKDGNGPTLLVQSLLSKAPLTITDDDLFTDVIQNMIFGKKKVILGIQAKVDVEVSTGLGEFAIRNIPASGSVPVKPVRPGSGFGALQPKIGNLQIVDSTDKSLTIEAVANFTNPTEYTATVPYMDIHILKNGSLLGHATARNITVWPGKNTNIPVTAYWDPLTMGGTSGHSIGVELLSQFISGYNTTITVAAHKGSIPSNPSLGRALSKFSFEIPTPHLGSSRPDDPDGDLPSDPPDDGKMHFISDATMHLITSTSTFNLLSPLKTSTLYVTYINATALYKGKDVGHIEYDEPFEVPPGKVITTPRLPVDWDLGSVGYDAVKNALGGSLKLAARATVGVRLGRWEERVWFQGKGIGAKIRL